MFIYLELFYKSMRRKLVVQGKSTLTISLPKRWVELQGVSVGDEVEIGEEQGVLQIQNVKSKKPLKEITFIAEGSYNQLRSLLGGFYRGGYEKITLQFSHPKLVEVISDVVDSLYGAEMYELNKNSCIIRIFDSEEDEILPHFNRMIHIITTMIDLIHTQKKGAHDEIWNFRNKILRERDLILRMIIHRRLLDNRSLPYYSLAGNVWNIARNYSHYYDAQEKITKVDLHTEIFFDDTNKLCVDFFRTLRSPKHDTIDRQYRILIKEGEKLICNKKSNPQLIAYCLSILMLVQSSNSHALLLSATPREGK